jgi:hypothetical protein
MDASLVITSRSSTAFFTEPGILSAGRSGQPRSIEPESTRIRYCLTKRRDFNPPRPGRPRFIAAAYTRTPDVWSNFGTDARTSACCLASRVPFNHDNTLCYTLVVPSSAPLDWQRHDVKTPGGAYARDFIAAR